MGLTEDLGLHVLVLAGGDGTRLRALTRRIAGTPIPKQYCRLLGDRSLLEVTLARVAPLAPRGRTFAVVNADHLAIADAQLGALPPANVLVQAANRDTGPGLLFSLLGLARGRPRVRVAVFPSDHYVADERAFRRHVRRALRVVEEVPDKIALLGIAPERPDGELGYIEPAAAVATGRPGAFHVSAFHEKPDDETLAELHRRGSLWNSFVMVFELPHLLPLVRRERPDDFARMAAWLAEPEPQGYDTLPSWNFSRDFLARIPEHLAVVRADATGWSDWGTPEAIARTLAAGGAIPWWVRGDAAA